MEALKGSRETKTRTKVLAPAKVLTGLLYGPDLGLPMTCDTDESSSRVTCRCRFTTAARHYRYLAPHTDARGCGNRLQSTTSKRQPRQHHLTCCQIKESLRYIKGIKGIFT
jgi:hypothetical protein